MDELDRDLRAALTAHADELPDTVVVPDGLAGRVRRRRTRKLVAALTTAAVVTAVLGIVGFRGLVDEDASEITPAGHPRPGEVVAQRQNGAIVVLETDTGQELRELVPAGRVTVSTPDDLVVSPDGEYVYFVDEPFVRPESGSSVADESAGEVASVTFEIFMAQDATESEIAEVERRMREDAEVATYERWAGEQAYEELRRFFADEPDLVEGIDPEDFPVSFRVVSTVNDGRAGAIAERYRALPGVGSVASGTVGVPETGESSRPPLPSVARVPIAGGEPERFAVGVDPEISPDGSMLAVGSLSMDVPTSGRTNGITLYDTETGETRTVHASDPEAAGAVSPLGWVDDTTLVAVAVGDVDQSSFLLDTESADPVLAPTGEPVTVGAYATHDGAAIVSEPAPDDPEATRFATVDLLGGGEARVLATTDVAALALDVDDSGANVLFAGVPEFASTDIFTPSEEGRHPDAFVGYVDEDGVTHEISGDAVLARWVPGTEPEPEREREPETDEAPPPMPAEIVVQRGDGSVVVLDSSTGDEIRTLLPSRGGAAVPVLPSPGGAAAPGLAVSPDGHDVFASAGMLFPCRSIFRASADGTELMELDLRGTGPLLTSPDGATLAYTSSGRCDDPPSTSEGEVLELLDLTSGETRRYVPDGDPASLDPLFWDTNREEIAISVGYSGSVPDGAEPGLELLDPTSLETRALDLPYLDPAAGLVAAFAGASVVTTDVSSDPESPEVVARDFAGEVVRSFGSVGPAVGALDVDRSGRHVLAVELVDSTSGSAPRTRLLRSSGDGFEVVAEDVLAAHWLPASPSRPQDSGDGTTDDEELLQIGAQAAALRQLLEVDHTFADPGHRFDRVFVVDHAEDPSGEGGAPGPAFTDDERQVLREAVADLADLEWVGSAQDVPGADTSEGIIRNSAAVTLGPVESAGEETRVGVGMFCGNVCGYGTTYVVAETPSGWEVTGTTGVAFIS